MDDRLGEIGRRAARLCYADRCPAENNICVGSCAAVCPEDKYLIAASREIFAEYWATQPAVAAISPPSAPDAGEER